jgi:hypothetical protein
MTNYRSARACAVKPLRLGGATLRALGLDRSARPKQTGCRDLNAGTCSKVPPFGKKERKKRSWPPQKLLTRETSYKVFGRRPDTVPNERQARWPASENLQRRKPREKVRAVPLSESQAAPEGDFLYNLSVMARRLLIGGK